MAFQGWWVNGITGRGYHVAEHGLEVIQEPERYGLTRPEVMKLLSQVTGKYNAGDPDPEAGRGLILQAAMRHGWVRVRGYRNRYAIQTFGNLASRLPKVMQFLRQAGVGPRAELLVVDLASGYQQNFDEGMTELTHALKTGKVPNVAPRPRINLRARKPDGVPTGMSDKQSRVMLRQRLGQRAGVADPSPKDDFLEEQKRGDALERGLQRLLG